MQDKALRKSMDTASGTEKNRGKIEKRTIFVTNDTDWLAAKAEWENLRYIRAVHTEFEVKGVKISKWHYYISSRELSEERLLHHARMEWSVETMRWLLDVHFEEDFCRVEDKNIQQNLNMFRKLVINLIKQYKEKSAPKRFVSKIMFDCLQDSSFICAILEN